MLYLIGCIVFSSCLTLAFKVTARYKLNNLQVIVFNYLACVIVGSLINGHFPLDNNSFQQPWIGWAFAMGTIFVTLFSIIGFTAQRVGVAITSVAYKLSLVIPFLFSLYLYNEKATLLKITGIMVALAAIILTCWPSQKKDEKGGQRNLLLLLMPLLLFVGSGLLDTMIKYVEQGYLDESNKNEFLIMAFLMAAVVGMVVFAIQLLARKQIFSWKAVLAGLIIGIPNYLSMWCLLRVLKNYPDNSSAIIPINNMAIVLFSSVMAWLLFKEKLSGINWLGIVLAMGAIALIAYG